MDIMRWNPESEGGSLHRGFNRLFNDFFTPFDPLLGGIELSEWRPRVDISERDGKFFVKAELPGMEKKDIDIEVQDGILTLKGERTRDKEVKDEKYHFCERVYGKFERSFKLPVDIDAESIVADFKDGVLTLEVPVPEKQKPRQIAIH